MNWDEAKAYIHDRYSATDISPNAIEIIFGVGEDRTQGVFACFADDYGERTYVTLDSPFAVIGTADPLRAIRMADECSIGGVCFLYFKGQDCLSLRHAMRLEHLHPDELDAALGMIAGAADMFERELTGQDNF